MGNKPPSSKPASRFSWRKGPADGAHDPTDRSESAEGNLPQHDQEKLTILNEIAKYSFSPTGSLLECTKLVLQNRTLADIPEGLSLLRNLKFLRLNSNSLSTLPQWFGRLTSIEKLYLDENLLEELPESLSQLMRLDTLNLYSNPISHLPPWISALTGLYFLSVQLCPLEILPEAITHLTNLKLLYIEYEGGVNISRAHLGVSHLPCWGEGNIDHKHIRRLDLYDCFETNRYIREISGRISEWNAKGYKSIDISCNKISEIPDSITILSNLQKLCLAHNELHQVEDKLYQLTKLKALDLSYNKITFLPNNISKLSGLTRLALQKNLISHLTDSIVHLSRLEILDLSDNQIASIACGLE